LSNNNEITIIAFSKNFRELNSPLARPGLKDTQLSEPLFYWDCLFRMCLVSHFTEKFLGFGPLFCKIELNTMQIFLAKMYPFSILDFGLTRQKKKAKSQKVLAHLMKI
jgi:hypothetical protein